MLLVKMAIHQFPQIRGINPRFWGDSSLGQHCEFPRDCYAAIMRINGPVWDRLAANDTSISDEIFDKLETTGPQHSGSSWMCLVAYYRDLARTGFPDRFLLENQHLWVMGHYMPDYFPAALFIAGAGLITALSW